MAAGTSFSEIDANLADALNRVAGTEVIASNQTAAFQQGRGARNYDIIMGPSTNRSAEYIDLKKDDVVGSQIVIKPKIPKGDEGVVAVVVEHTDEKVKQLGSRLEDQRKSEEKAEAVIKESQKRLLTIKRAKESLEEKYNKLNQVKRSELVEEYRRVITKLKLSPLIDEFRVDDAKRVIVRTTPLEVMKTHWRKPKIAGVFEIRIDFSKKEATDGIRVLNITQRKQDYDSPTILNTKPCWGNMYTDIENDYNAQDLYELVMDMIDYIVSPFDIAGFLSDDKISEKRKEKGGWEVFFKGARPQVAGFCFEVYEQNKESKKIKHVTVNNYGVASVASDNVIRMDTSSRLIAWDINSATTTFGGTDRVLSNFASQPQPYRQSYEETLQQGLRAIGLTPAGAYHFAELLTRRSRTDQQGEEIDQIDLTLQRENYILYVRRLQRQEMMTASERPRNITASVERYFLNEADIEESGLREIRERGSVRFRFPRFGNEHLSDQEQRYREESDIRERERLELLEHMRREPVERDPVDRLIPLTLGPFDDIS